MKHKNTQPSCIFIRENPQNGPRRGLDFIAFVIGTFKNGSFHGPGKVIFEDGVVLVSDFKNGMPAGMSRTFDKDGKLLTV